MAVVSNLPRNRCVFAHFQRHQESQACAQSYQVTEMRLLFSRSVLSSLIKIVNALATVQCVKTHPACSRFPFPAALIDIKIERRHGVGATKLTTTRLVLDIQVQSRSKDLSFNSIKLGTGQNSGETWVVV